MQNLVRFFCPKREYQDHVYGRPCRQAAPVLCPEREDEDRARMFRLLVMQPTPGQTPGEDAMTTIETNLILKLHSSIHHPLSGHPAYLQPCFRCGWTGG